MLLNGTARPDLIARTAANIVYRGPAFALIDYDTKGMPATVASELQRHGGFWPALLTVLPALEGVARLTRSSTSAGLSRSDTGAVIAGSDGVHVYLVVKDGADIERFLRALHDRCWLKGLGWFMVSRSGALLDRSLVDRMVGQASRLVFEGGPVLKPPLQQDKASRRPVSIAGVVLDTLAACPPLTIVEQSRLDELKARERERLAPEKAKAQAAFVERQAKKLVARKGISGGRGETGRPPAVRRHIAAGYRASVRRPRSGRVHRRRRAGGPGAFRGRDAGRPAGGRGVRALQGKDHAPGRRHAVDPLFRPWPHHLRTQVRRRRACARRWRRRRRKTWWRPLPGSPPVPTSTRSRLAELRQLAKKLSGAGLRAINAALKAAQKQQAAQQAQGRARPSVPPFGRTRGR